MLLLLLLLVQLQSLNTAPAAVNLSAKYQCNSWPPAGSAQCVQSRVLRLNVLCAVLCHAAPCCAAPCCAESCCAMLCCVVLRHAVLCCVAQIASLNPGTHAYSFWEGVPHSGKKAFGRLFRTSTTMKVGRGGEGGVSPAARTRFGWLKQDNGPARVCAEEGGGVDVQGKEVSVIRLA
jgi:hypothetical protein